MKKPIVTAELMERVSGNTEFARTMLDTFFASYTERISALQDNLNAGEFAEMADNAHKMKGIVGNLAIHEVFQLLKELHRAAGLKDPKKAEKLISKIDREIKRAEDYFKSNPELN